ncbi:unnamed protein product [Mucor hiemalis]
MLESAGPMDFESCLIAFGGCRVCHVFDNFCNDPTKFHFVIQHFFLGINYYGILLATCTVESRANDFQGFQQRC